MIIFHSSSLPFLRHALFAKIKLNIQSGHAFLCQQSSPFVIELNETFLSALTQFFLKIRSFTESLKRAEMVPTHIKSYTLLQVDV